MPPLVRIAETLLNVMDHAINAQIAAPRRGAHNLDKFSQVLVKFLGISGYNT